ncbi:MAG TPA: hypothetical protein VHD62_14935 [Opitutaceae bacterium]|nr:hypothetical protein [Opitutaceae bacterium]
MNPPPLLTRRELKRIAPLSAGKILGLLYGTLGLLIIPLFLLMAIGTANLPPAQRGVFAFIGVGMAFAAPIIYGILGFVFGLLGAALYNLFAKWVGGIEVQIASRD